MILRRKVITEEAVWSTLRPCSPTDLHVPTNSVNQGGIGEAQLVWLNTSGHYRIGTSRSERHADVCKELTVRPGALSVFLQLNCKCTVERALSIIFVVHTAKSGIQCAHSFSSSFSEIICDKFFQMNI